MIASPLGTPSGPSAGWTTTAAAPCTAAAPGRRRSVAPVAPRFEPASAGSPGAGEPSLVTGPLTSHAHVQDSTTRHVNPLGSDDRLAGWAPHASGDTRPTRGSVRPG